MIGERWRQWFGKSSAGGSQAETGETLVAGNTAFALDLYGGFSGGAGNLFFSPYGISTCLAIAYAGARGETERQMGAVMRFGPKQAEIHAGFSGLQRRLNELEKDKVVEYKPGFTLRTGIQLSIANALWAQMGHPFLPAFLEIAEREYAASIKQADFKTEAGTVVSEINRWVAEQTRNRIQNMLAPGSVDEWTRMVLANAIYFKGEWANPFEAGQTALRPFHISASERVKSWLMHQAGHVGYMENKEFQGVELPYKGGDLTMVILLPRQIDGCGALKRRLDPALLVRSLAQMKRQAVEVFLPKFKLESKFELSGTLAKMGMPDAFTWPQADFSGLDGGRDLFISQIFHKAWAEVSEKGTEAAAATTMVIAKGCHDGPAPPRPVFRADHPFIFFIREVRSGSLLFAGRLADPRG